MGRPYSPKTLLALQDYTRKDERGYLEPVKVIAERHGIAPQALSRAASKHGVSRRPTQEAE